MIITVDTSKDSPETMRKAARFLEELAGTSSAPAEPTADMFSMMDVSEPAQPQSEPEQKQSPSRVLPYDY